jgi:hypothetical protein
MIKLLCYLTGEKINNKTHSGIFINSYPRTGSTYLEYAVRMFLNNSDFGDHVHSIFLVSRLIEDCIQVVTLRDPIETIGSNMYNDFLKYYSLDNKKIDNAFLRNQSITHESRYTAFQKNIIKNKTNLTVVTFENFTNNIKDTLKEICNPDDLFLQTKLSNEEIDKKIKDKIKHNFHPKSLNHIPTEKTEEHITISNYLNDNKENYSNIYEIYLTIKNSL